MEMRFFKRSFEKMFKCTDVSVDMSVNPAFFAATILTARHIFPFSLCRPFAVAFNKRGEEGEKKKPKLQKGSFLRI